MNKKRFFISHFAGACYEGSPGNATYSCPQDMLTGSSSVALSKIGFDLIDLDAYFILRTGYYKPIEDGTNDYIYYPENDPGKLSGIIGFLGQKFFLRDILGSSSAIFNSSYTIFEEKFNAWALLHPFYTGKWIPDDNTPNTVDITLYFKVEYSTITSTLTFYAFQTEVDSDWQAQEDNSYLSSTPTLPNVLGCEVEIGFSSKFFQFLSLSVDDMEYDEDWPYYPINESTPITADIWKLKNPDNNPYWIYNDLAHTHELTPRLTIPTYETDHPLRFIAVGLELPEAANFSTKKTYFTNFGSQNKKYFLKIIPLVGGENNNEYSFDFEKNGDWLDVVYLGNRKHREISKIKLVTYIYPPTNGNLEIYQFDKNLYYELFIFK